MKNRSVPVDTVLPHIVYENLPAAIEWLTGTVGFVEQYRYGDPVAGVMLRLGKAYVMARAAREDSASPSVLGRWTQSLTIFVDRVNEHHQRTKSAAGNIVEDLHETVYGELQYAVMDPAGHHWLFSQHAHDRSPESWGANSSTAADHPRDSREIV